MNRCRTLSCLPVVFFTVEILPYFSIHRKRFFQFFRVSRDFRSTRFAFFLSFVVIFLNCGLFSARKSTSSVSHLFQLARFVGFCVGNFTIHSCPCFYPSNFDLYLYIIGTCCYWRHNSQVGLLFPAQLVAFLRRQAALTYIIKTNLYNKY